ncbi:MAG: hypothetical protein WAM97_00505 [Acidimicrobiales bacterium]
MTEPITERIEAHDEAAPSAPAGWRRSVATVGGGFLVFLVLSVILWWHVWTSHPSTVTTCACDDPSLFVWFLEWPAYAIAHGHNPFFSSSLFYPQGFNLLSNTGVLALGIPLAPITWLFGPVVTLNVVYTLAPALTATSMLWLLRRWVSWTPAAFIGGLVFGFSPFAFANLALAHFNTEMLVFVPLILGCLDEILIRQKRTYRTGGLVLGLLVTVQFFLSTEMLAIVAITGLLGLLILLVYASARHRSDIARLFPHAIKALAVAAVVAIVLLAYPIWFDLAGPAHLSGLLWPKIVPGTGGIVLSDLWHLRFMSANALRIYGGYEGPNGLPHGAYLGIGLLVVVVAGIVAFRRERKLWYFCALAILSGTFSLGLPSTYWVPWKVLAHIPVVQNIAVARFFAMPLLCISILLAITVDRVRTSAKAALGRVLGTHLERRTAKTALVVSAAFGIAVAAVAVVPMGSSVARNVPFTVEGVDLPAWFSEVGAHLPDGQVVLTFPPPVSGGQGMTWQAIDLLRFAMATGGGPQSISQRAGKEMAGFDLITQASLVFSPPPPATQNNVRAVREALTGWNVSQIVVPDPSSVEPFYDRGGSTAWALGMFTLAVGRPPAFTDDAWVWSEVRSPGRRLVVSPGQFARCTAGSFNEVSRYLAVSGCIISAARS